MKISLLILLLSLSYYTYGYSCNVIDHGFDQKIIIEYDTGDPVTASPFISYPPDIDISHPVTFTVTIGEMPTVSAAIGFFYLNTDRKAFIECLDENNLYVSYRCNKRMNVYDILGHKDVYMLETIGNAYLSWRDTYPYMEYTSLTKNTNCTVDNAIPIGTKNGTTCEYYTQKIVGSSRTYRFQKRLESLSKDGRLFMFISLRNRLFTDLRNITPTDEYWIIAKELSISEYIDPTCSFYKYLYSKSRWDIYNYSRMGRFATIILATLFVIILNIIYRRYNVVKERAFSTIISVGLYFLYGVLGLVFSIYDWQFQAYEYCIYITISNVYFMSFIKFAVNRFIQSQGTKYYAKLSSSGVLNKSSTSVIYYKSEDISVDRYRNLSTLANAIPREMIDGWIFWFNILCNIYTIVIAIYDLHYKTSYATFGPSVSILRFVGPIGGSLVPAIIALVIDIRALPIRNFREGISKYASIHEDPLLYRYEFIIALCGPLPLAIITFCLGYIDTNSIVLDYFIGRRAIIYTFHAIFYTMFDVSFLFLTTGMYIIHRGSQIFISSDDDIDYTPDVQGRKWTEIDVALYLLSQDEYGKKDMFDYCTRANMIDIWTLYIWLNNMIHYRDPIQMRNSMNIFLDQFYRTNINYTYTIFDQYKDICIQYELLSKNGIFNKSIDSTIEKKALKTIARKLYELTEDTLFGTLAATDFIKTLDFQEHFELNRDKIAEYIVGILDDIDDSASTCSSESTDDILKTKIIGSKRGDMIIYNREMLNTVSERMSLLLIPSEDICTLSDDDVEDDDIPTYNIHHRNVSFSGRYEENVGIITPSEDINEQYIEHRSMKFELAIELDD